MTLAVSPETLDRLPESLSAPRDDRSRLSPGIVHIGVGDFHLAQKAVYLDDLMNAGKAHDWAVVGGGVRPGDAAMRERLARQGLLSTVVELEPGALRGRVVAAMTEFTEVSPANGGAQGGDRAARVSAAARRLRRSRRGARLPERVLGCADAALAGRDGRDAGELSSLTLRTLGFARRPCPEPSRR